MSHHDESTPFLERLTEAQLEGRPLPEPANDDEAALLEQFQQTDTLFEEFRSMRLGNDWMKEVWARVDRDGAHDGKATAETGETPSASQPTADSPAASPPATPDAADDEDDDDADDDASRSAVLAEGSVIDARSRFRLWPLLGGLALAATALFALAIPVMMARDGAEQREDEMARSAEAPAASVVAEEESAAPADEASGASASSAKSTRRPEATESFEPAPTADSTTETGTGRATTTVEMPAGGIGHGGGARGDFGGADGEGEPAAPPVLMNAPSEVAAAEDPGNSRSSSKKDRPRDARGDSDGASGAGWGEREKDKKPLDDLAEGGEWGDGRSRSGGWQRPARVQLTAGEVDDNGSFDDFQRFLSERSKPHLEPMDVSERMFVRVLDRNNRPLANATVDFQVGGQSVFQATTYSDGWVLFHPRTVPQAAQAEGFDLLIRAGQAEHSYRVQRGTKEEWQVRLPVERTVAARQKLDLVFLLDTTQSMQDQIDTLQATITDVAAQVAALPGEPEVRFGLVLFRDDTDEYVSRVFDFGTDVVEFQRLLAQQQAAGGGDLPERLEVGLHKSIHELSWNPDAARMVFLVGDAAPHKRTLNEFSYSADIQAAASRGIKVFTVATSGLDDDGEYVFRQLAQFTMARFVFLTSGASGTSTPHDVKPGSFQPETLDRLVVRLVRQELAGLELDESELREARPQQQR